MNARWIWTAGETEPNAWAAFRHAFDLAETGPSRLRVACADKYWLWINGALVVREGGLKSGPTREDWYADELEVSAHLRKGRNQIAVLAWYFGRDGRSHRNSGRAGLFVELETGGARVVTDGTWKARRHPAFGQRGGGLSVWLAEQAVDFDAASDMPGWPEEGFEDSGWDNANELGAPPCAPWGRLVARPIPFWRDGEPRCYENADELALPVSGPATVTGRLPANLHVYPRFRLRARAGLEVAVQVERDKKLTLYRTREGGQTFEAPAWGNGHWVEYRIPEGAELLEISYRETGYDCDFAGRFACSDAGLAALWEKAARTAYVCMRDTFMDCPDRERSPWIGDIANTVEVSLRALGRSADRLVVKTLDELAGWAAPGGNLWSSVPTSLYAGTFREFPAQTLLMLGFAFPAFLAHTGDLAVAGRFYPAMRRYLFEVQRVDDGVVEHRGPWAVGWDPGVQCWYDWNDNIDMEAMDQVLHYAALGALEQAADALGETADADRCRGTRGRIREVFNAKYWSEADGGYRSARHDGPSDERVQGMAIVAGIAPVDRLSALAEQIEAGERCSIYMERFPLEALVLAGRPAAALERFRKRFAREIESDYSTLPECFGEESNHAWGGAAVVLLAERLMGISIIGPGCREVRFVPPSEGLDWADVTLPTIHGPLRLAFRRRAGGIDYELTVPEGVRVELGGGGLCEAGTWTRRVEG